MSIWMTEDDFRALALNDGVREIALDDAWLNFRDYSGSVREFLAEMKPDRPHWWSSPAEDTLDNAALYSIEDQGAYVKAHGVEAARSMLAAEGLKLGQIRKAEVKDHSKDNPYAPAAAGQEAAREDRIVRLVKSGGAALAASLAKSAGCDIAGRPLKK